MIEKNLLKSEAESTYSYKNAQGEIETIDIITGERLDKKIFQPITNYKYSQDFCDLVCQLLREGMTLTAICKMEGFPSYSTVCRWKKQNQEFNELLEEAKKDRAEVFMDKIITIADNSMDGKIDKDGVTAMRLATDGFEKAASAGDPATYGKAKDQQVRIENLIMINTGIDAPVVKSQVLDITPKVEKIES